jgi:hypothetical protein
MTVTNLARPQQDCERDRSVWLRSSPRPKSALDPAEPVASGEVTLFHATLSHDINGLSSVDFVVTLQRGTEWAATGSVTQKVPANFPTATSVSYRTDLASMDPGYKKGLNGLDK